MREVIITLKEREEGFADEWIVEDLDCYAIQEGFPSKGHAINWAICHGLVPVKTYNHNTGKEEIL